MDELTKWLMSAGVLGALATIAGVFINRRGVKAAARALDLKTPAEVDNLVATTHMTQMQIAVDLNTVLAAENKRLTGRLTGIDERLDEQEAALTEMRDRVGNLTTGLASAYAYITTLLGIIREHLPNVTIPPHPEGYTPPPKG